METKTPLTSAFAERVATDKTFMNRDKTTNYLDAFSAALDEMEKLELALSAVRRDAERYRWLRANPNFIGWEHDFMPEQVDKEIDRAIADDAALSAEEK